MRIPDWDIKVQFKNFSEYYIPFESIRYLWAASKPGNFSTVVPLNDDTMDVLRGSEITFLYRGEEMFAGKITNRTPDFVSGIITLEGLDWLGLMNERQISFMSYDKSGYSWAGGSADDSWNYAGGATGVPGKTQDLEGAEMILRLLRHYTGRNMTDTEFGDPDDMPYVTRSITYKPWMFEGETLLQSIQKTAKVMQSSNLRFGYNFWVDGNKNWYLRRYGDQVYAKKMMCEWSPPKEETITIVNHIHFIGGIATPFPSDRESLTDYSWTGTEIKALNTSGNQWKAPTSNSKGWGAWIKRDGYDAGTPGYIQVEGDDDLGFVTGADQKCLHISFGQQSGTSNVDYSMGFYYQINNANSEFRDDLYPDKALRNWSNRAQLDDRKAHQVMTLTFYFRASEIGSLDDWPDELYGAKLKLYTGSAPTFPPTENPEADVYETSQHVFDLDITDVFHAYRDKMTQWDNDDAQFEWMRVAFVFHEDVEYDTYANLRIAGSGGGGGGGGGGIRPKIDVIIEQGGNLDVRAWWNNFSDRNLPDPADIWGIGLEFSMRLDSSGVERQWAFDHIFFGFGEIRAERWDDISIQANRHAEKWIHDRKCHSWSRAGHLTDVLLDSLKYAQKSRTGTLRYFNPELRPNMLIPVNEFGVEWMYVLDSIQVDINAQGTNMKLMIGSAQPDADELFSFYEVQRVNIESGGSGVKVADWTVNTKCETNCERYCQFACLSDWSSNLKRGGNVCQTARETTCQRCESTEEVNPCVVSCLKYSQIAAISQRAPAERSDVDNTLLMGTNAYTGHVPEKPVTEEPPATPTIEIPAKCRRRSRERF